MRHSGLFWGAVLVVVGGLLLLDNLGILRVNIWSLAWPIGLLLFGAWILVGVFRGGRPVAIESFSLPLGDTTQATIGMHHGAGKMVVRDQAAPDLLLDGTFSGVVVHTENISNRRMTIDLRASLDRLGLWGAPWGNNRGREWTVALSQCIPLSLNFETGAAEADINLQGMQVSDFRLSTGTSLTHVVMPANGGYTRAKLEAGAASISVRIAGGVAARIRTQSGLSSITVDQKRFQRSGDVYASPDYETMPNKVDIDVQMGVSSVSIS